MLRLREVMILVLGTPAESGMPVRVCGNAVYRHDHLEGQTNAYLQCFNLRFLHCKMSAK